MTKLRVWDIVKILVKGVVIYVAFSLFFGILLTVFECKCK